MSSNAALSPETAAFYRRCLRTLRESNLSVLAGGAHALEYYTDITRRTKDLDLFVRPSDLEDTLSALADAGYETERTFPHWLAKVRAGEDTVDLVYRSSNGVSEVNDRWFERASTCEVLGVPTGICPPEEMIWQKSFVMERERFDGADVAHLLLRCAGTLDWDHLLELFKPHWRLLFSHLVLFGFIYPAERARIPQKLIDRLLERLQIENESPPPDEPLCQGTLLSGTQYLIDVKEWGYRDARLAPTGPMSAQEIEEWTHVVQDKTQGD